MLSKIIVIISAMLTLIGCATKPADILPQYTNELLYSNHTCEQMAEEHARLTHALTTAANAQWKARGSDTAGMVLLGLPVGKHAGVIQPVWYHSDCPCHHYQVEIKL